MTTSFRWTLFSAYQFVVLYNLIPQISLRFLSSANSFWIVEAFHIQPIHSQRTDIVHANTFCLLAWVQDGEEWIWKEDDPSYVFPLTVAELPKLPSQTHRPKQSLGQNYLTDPNTVTRILRYFQQDAVAGLEARSITTGLKHILELGPGAGALTDTLVKMYKDSPTHIRAIEIDERSVELLQDKHANADYLTILHGDVLLTNFTQLAIQQDHPLVIVGNLPYYITSQILFSLADEAAFDSSISSATITMQLEVAQRLVASPRTKAYGILSVVFQLYCTEICLHTTIPSTVFYPQPKVTSALVGLSFGTQTFIQQRLDGVAPAHFRTVVRTAFGQRRKTLKKSLKALLLNKNNTSIPEPWASQRPEELEWSAFVQLTKWIYGTNNMTAHKNVWRKAKHGGGGAAAEL